MRAGDLTPREAWDLLAADPRAVLVDVRTRAERAFVGVAEAPASAREVGVEWVTYPRGEHNAGFLAELAAAAPERDAPVVFLCRSGHRSVGASDAATAAGWTSAWNVLDGFEGPVDGDGHRGGAGWRAEGLPWHQS